MPPHHIPVQTTPRATSGPMLRCCCPGPGIQFTVLLFSLSGAAGKEQASGPHRLPLAPASLSENVLEMQSLGPWVILKPA